MTRIIINGACGRMGQRISSLAMNDSELQLVGALERDGHPDLGKDYGLVLGLGELDITVGSDPSEGDVLIDFTAPASTLLRAQQASEKGIGLVVGTTGLEDEHKAALLSASEKVPVLLAPNMSLGVNVLFRIAGEVAKILGGSFDIDIVEAHHNEKVDAPSGTAVRLAEVVCDALGRDYPEGVIFGRQGNVGARPKGEVAVHAIRGGDIVGDHTVLFAGDGERIELVHRAHSRDTFANGALRAAKFVHGKPPAMYSITDVLESELGG
jgi:4-hydroxy-tetrahydrodipicolinate reductase